MYSRGAMEAACMDRVPADLFQLLTPIHYGEPAARVHQHTGGGL